MTNSTPLPSHTSTLVIGGGPAGIVSLKYLVESGDYALGEEPVCVEMESEIGGTFRYASSFITVSQPSGEQ